MPYDPAGRITKKKQLNFEIHFLSNEQKIESLFNQSSEGPGIAQFNQEKEMTMDIIFVMD